MSARFHNYEARLQRKCEPELEHAFARSSHLGYEAPGDTGLIRCLAHGFPTPLARWHYHDEYELHLITATSGKAFVGDWLGTFSPGHLVLCGPRLPHNWISVDVPDTPVLERDLVIQFAHQPMQNAAEQIPELAELMPMLERASHGIEFFDMGDTALQHWQQIKQSRGMRRFAAFCDLMGELARCTDYRLLSNVQMQGESNDVQLAQINGIVNRISADLAQSLSLTDIADELGMSASQFSRFFKNSTGNTFTDFVSHLRINRAAQLLMGSQSKVLDICYEVGFNNVANFNRRFREIRGMTPSEFRAQADGRFGP